MPPLNPPADDEPGATSPTPESPATSREDAPEADMPQWIEVGTPQRRPFPPAWSDEATMDAWSAPMARDRSSEPAAMQVDGEAPAAADPWVQGPVDSFVETDADDPAGPEADAPADHDADGPVADDEAEHDAFVDEQPTEPIPVAGASDGWNGRPEDPTEPLILSEVHDGQPGDSQDVTEPLPLIDAEGADRAEDADDAEEAVDADDAEGTADADDAADELATPAAEETVAGADAGDDVEDPEDGSRWQVVDEGHGTEQADEGEPIAQAEPDQSDASEVHAEDPVESAAVNSAAEDTAEELAAESVTANEDAAGEDTAAAGLAAEDPDPVAPAAAHDPETGAGVGVATALGATTVGAAAASSTAAPSDAETAGPARRPHSPQPPASPQSQAPAPEAAAEHGTSQEKTETKKQSPRNGSPSKHGTVQGAFDVLGPHIGEQRAAVITGGILAVLSVWLLVALPFPLKAAVDAVTGSDAGASLSVPVLVLIVVLLAHVATAYGAVAAFGRAGTRVAASLRSRLIRHIHALAPDAAGQSLDTAPSEKTSGPLTEDVGRLRDLLAFAGPRLAAGLLAIACSLVVLLLVTPLAALVVAVTGLVLALIARMLTRRNRAAHRHAVAEEVLLADSAHELVSATRTIQYYGLEEHSRQSLAEVGARAGQARAAARRADAALRTAGSVITGLGLAALVMVAGSSLRAGSITPGDLALTVFYLLLTSIVLQQLLSRHSGSLSAAAEAGDRLRELLDRPTGIADPERAQPVPSVRGEIVFSAITAAGRHRHLFDTVSFVVPAGQHVALMDLDGAESSALISYLLRFDQPETGRVLLDRFDTRTVSLPDLRRQIAVVQREPALFTDTARENIRIGRPDASDDEVVAAARAAGADEVITSLPDGYDTVLARRGAALTDGGRRRIAIARALLRDAPIVVLDGADEDLAGTERDAVLTSLAALTAGRTAIVASREPATVAGMDRVVWFRDGEIGEDAAPGTLAEDPDSQYATWLRALDEDLR